MIPVNIIVSREHVNIRIKLTSITCPLIQQSCKLCVIFRIVFVDKHFGGVPVGSDYTINDVMHDFRGTD
jgi:hypothetical protein